MLHNGIVQIRVRFLNPGGQKRSPGGCLQCIHAFQSGSLGPEGLKVFCLGFNGFIIVIISLFGVQGIVAGVNQFEQFVQLRLGHVFIHVDDAVGVVFHGGGGIQHRGL